MALSREGYEVKTLKKTREHASKHALPKIEIDLSLAKAEFADLFNKATDFIFDSKSFETFLNCCVVVGVMYFVGHLILAWMRGWPL